MVTVNIQEKRERKETEVAVKNLLFKDINTILCWCFENYIDADFVTSRYNNDNNNFIIIWNIKDDKERTLFLLRWGN